MMEDNGSKSASAKEISANTSGADVDNALQYVKSLDATSQVHVDEAKLVRRIDWLIVPLMCKFVLAFQVLSTGERSILAAAFSQKTNVATVYTLQFIDKILINYANVMGLEEDTHINGNQYSQLALIFYVSFLACELPTGFLMQRFPLAKYLGANVILWGVVISLTCIAKNWAALISLRVLLGVFESAVAPALILITSMWYKRSEQPARVGFWAVGSGVGTIIGALASFGFQHYSSNDFTSWQIMFLLFGLITIVVGVLVFFILPDSPMASRFSHEEKQVIIERIRENQTGIENKNFKFKQFFECLYDPQTWLLCLIMIADSVPNAAVTSFQATLIKGFGYTSKEAALLSIPSGTVSTLGVIGGGLCATKLGMRGPFVLATMLIGGVLGGCLLAFSPSTNQGALMTGIYLTNVSRQMLFCILLVR